MIVKTNGNQIIVDNGSGMVATLNRVGASLQDLIFDKKHMVLSPAEGFEADFLPGYFGKTIGRICGRVKNCDLTFGGKTYKVTKNDNDNCLHGGKKAISDRLWEVTSIKEGKDVTTVVFDIDSPDGEEGFPFDVKITCTYEIGADNTINMKYSSLAEKDTPVNITNHTYWNLGEADAKKAILSANTTRFFPAYDDVTIDSSKTEYDPVMDFSKGVVVGEAAASEFLKVHFGGYDHCFPFDKGEKWIEVKQNGYVMRMTTDYDCFQFFSSNFPSDKKFTNGYTNSLRCGLALEPQDLPNDFDGMISKAGKPKERFIKYALRKGE